MSIRYCMEKFLEALVKAKHVTFLTGAGVSTASGIPDFKSTDDTWPYDEPRELLISLPYFQRNPEHFWKVYREVFSSKFNAEENDVHRWIGELERTKYVHVITQNVDGLHQKGGSNSVIEIHGTNTQAVCLKCGKRVPMEDTLDSPLPRCGNCNKVLKPGVCLFNENVYGLADAQRVLRNTDMLIVMGTSLEVGPVNTFPLYAQAYSELPLVWINRETPPQGYDFDHVLQTDLTEFVKSVPLK